MPCHTSRTMAAAEKCLKRKGFTVRDKAVDRVIEVFSQHGLNRQKREEVFKIADRYGMKVRIRSILLSKPKSRAQKV